MQGQSENQHKGGTSCRKGVRKCGSVSLPQWHWGGGVFSGFIYHDKGGLDNPVPLFKSIGEGRDEFGVESTSM